MLRGIVLLLVLSTCAAYPKETCKGDEDEDTLILTHVLFRHGDRTPDVSTIYPSDPYINETYYPFGKGQLTQAGKQRAYTLGKLLRQRYNSFLGPIYEPDMIEARSSAYPRTQMTLQLALTGLFPPTKEYKISNLNWQPIPYTFSDYDDDKLIATFRSCEKIFDIVDDLEKTVYREELKQYRRLYQYLSQYSGWDVNNTRLTFFIENTLKTESEWGLDLPAWTKKIWSEPLKNAAVNFWKLMSSTRELNKINIGNLIKKIVEDTEAKIAGENPRKIYLYSGHDFTVVPMLAALGNFDGRMAPYTAHVILELHLIDDVYGIKAFFQNYERKQPRLLDIPNCGTFCPWDQFVQIAKEFYPNDPWC